MIQSNQTQRKRKKKFSSFRSELITIKRLNWNAVLRRQRQYLSLMQYLCAHGSCTKTNISYSFRHSDSIQWYWIRNLNQFFFMHVECCYIWRLVSSDIWYECECVILWCRLKKLDANDSALNPHHAKCTCRCRRSSFMISSYVCTLYEYWVRVHLYSV